MLSAHSPADETRRPIFFGQNRKKALVYWRFVKVIRQRGTSVPL